MKLNSLKLDLNAAEDGVYFPFPDGAKVKIAKWANKNHAAFLREAVKKYNKKIKAGVITDDQADYLLAEQWPTIITDIVGFTEDDGVTEVKYSPNLIIDLARNPQFSEFFNGVELISRDEQNYRAESVKELGENLPSSSLGQ